MAQERPNILLITTDQQRFDTINALGNPYIYTPHLNWLVDEGIAYTNCYADCPICMPSRATIMTGQHGDTMGLVGNNNDVIPMSTLETLPQVLTRHGYQTRAQGKMHFHPIRANYGFEHMELPLDYYRARGRNAKEGLPKAHGVGENEVEPVISTVREQDSLTYWTVDRSIDFLETRDETRPFFLWTSFTKPHPPFDPCFNYWSLYQNRDVPPVIKGDWSQSIEVMPQGLAQSTYQLNNVYRMSEAQIADMRRAYYACITQIDYSLGLLFARMREMRLLENTWILFTSDHGDMQGDHCLGAKSVFLEGSAHVPLLIRPPMRSFATADQAGERCEALVDLADIMPTILSIAGIQPPSTVEGMDVRILVKSNTRQDHTLYGNQGDRLFMARDARYKYILTILGGDELLFDMDSDPYETRNLAADPSHGQTLATLRAKLLAHVAQTRPQLLKNDAFVLREAPKGPQSVPKWPGFHSIGYPTDVLH